MKIPENAKPYRAIVNGVEHVYEAGADVQVAPGVEELIEAADNFPAAPDSVVPPFAGGGGGGGGALAVTDTNGTLDKTWQEVHDAMISSGAVWVDQNGGVTSFVFAGENGMGQYHVDTATGDEFYTDSADGYPSEQ